MDKPKDLHERAVEMTNEILKMCGEPGLHVSDRQIKNVQDYICGFLMVARGKGIMAGVMERSHREERENK